MRSWLVFKSCSKKEKKMNKKTQFVQYIRGNKLIFIFFKYPRLALLQNVLLISLCKTTHVFLHCNGSERDRRSPLQGVDATCIHSCTHFAYSCALNTYPYASKQ